jgi:hypothetical protein
VKWLPITEFCHNNQVNTETGKTAFETIYGRHPRWDLTEVDSKVPGASAMSKEMTEIWGEVKASMEFHRTKEYAPKKEFEKGDQVWLVTTNIRTKRPMKKLDDKKLGPFTITEK